MKLVEDVLPWLLSETQSFFVGYDAEHITWLVRETVALFGAGRCLFGSNFPIEKLWTSLKSLVDAFLAATQELDDDDRNSIFHHTAERVYRI